MTQTAFVGDEVVSRYLFGFAVDLGQRQTTFFTVNKHWARVVFHDCTPDFVFASIKNPKKRKWLAAIAICGRIAESEPLSGVDSRFHYLWKEKDPDYPEAFGAALSGSLGFDRLRQNFLREQVFVSGSTEVDQDELAPEIFDSAYKSAFSWQKRPSFLRSNRPTSF